jgi:surface-anchored protein
MLEPMTKPIEERSELMNEAASLGPSAEASRPRGIGGLVIAALAAALLAVPGAAWAEGEDPDLEQSLAPEAQVASGERVLTAGHVDLGPKFTDGTWTLLVHDDAAKADPGGTSVWRRPAEAVIHVLDQAQLEVPNDPAYEFVGAVGGERVWVVPQTQNPEVVWLGWNTQDPEVMSRIDRGVALSLTGAEGPGVVTVYLQSGAFGEPQLLWDSRVTDPQPVWVDVNTHTHANWVFTKPGVYLLELTVEADLIDGTHVADAQAIRFAVGADTDPAEALVTAWEGGPASADGRAEGHDAVPASSPAASPVPPSRLETALIWAIALVAALLATAAVVAVVRGRRARRRALGPLENPSPGGGAASGRASRPPGDGASSKRGSGPPETRDPLDGRAAGESGQDAAP